MAHGRKIAVIGLGYVGLPVAVSFARSGVPVVGFDVDARRVAELKEGNDRTREVEGADLHQASLVLYRRSRGDAGSRISTSSPCRRRSMRRGSRICAR